MNKIINNKKFSSRLKNIIEMHGLTQREFAKSIGFTESAISKYLSGQRNPTLNLLCNIALKYNVSIDYLLGLKGDK